MRYAFKAMLCYNLWRIGTLVELIIMIYKSVLKRASMTVSKKSKLLILFAHIKVLMTIEIC
jgi:hypothetical protein